ncbi:unnamed protein product [Discosporangium mesarthrocarpum]
MKVTGMSVLAFAGVSSAFHVPSAPRTATRSSSTKLHITAQRTAEEAKEALIAIGGFDVETAKKPLDPLNFAMWVDPVKLREYETVHCRVAMLACVGFAFPEIYGMFDATDVTSPHGLEAIQQASPVAIAQIVAACGIVEANKYKHAQSGSEKPFYDPFMLWPKTEAKQEQMKMRELKNGRLAMLAWASFVSAALIPGSVPDFAIPF